MQLPSLNLALGDSGDVVAPCRRTSERDGVSPTL